MDTIAALGRPALVVAAGLVALSAGLLALGTFRERGDILEVKTATGSIRAPAHVYLGVRPDTVAVPMGQGHRSPSQDGWYNGKDGGVQWGYGRYARGIGANVLDVNVRGVPLWMLRQIVSALRKTSGMITAEPMFSTTPPSRRDRWAASRRKSVMLVAPIAAPSAAGC